MRALLILTMPLAFGATKADDCFALRGDRSPEAVAYMSRALEDPDIRSCAAENLRVIEAVEPLSRALTSKNPETRAAAARVLGTFRRNELIGQLAAVAADENLLAASNGFAALANYDAPAVIPALDQLARKGGMIGDLALDRLLKLDSSSALAAARDLLQHGTIADRLYALRIIGERGDSSDLPALKKIAAENTEKLESPSRGFGFMPAINLSRAANTAIESIRSR